MGARASSAGKPTAAVALIASAQVSSARAEREALQGFYEGFSLDVGLRDWGITNVRHEQLKLLAADALRDAGRGMRVLDVGCGSGVMTAYLERFGGVTGVDYSESAVQLAATMVPHGSFHAGALVDVELEPEAFDLITLFDVFEHVPIPQRHELAEELGRLLAPQGMLILSTPHPRTSEWMRRERPDLMQVVDEVVDLQDVSGLFDEFELTLTRYHSFDIERGGPQYQFMVFTRGLDTTRPRSDSRLKWRLRLVDNRLIRPARSWLRAARLARHGQARVARDLLRSRPSAR
jgi:SAM-dependent methyltransferase